MSKPQIRFAQAILRTWLRSDDDLQSKPCLAAPPCPAASFGCRADWRLNLVLNAGNYGSADALPVFESADEVNFNATMKRAMDRTLNGCGCISKDIVELPYNLFRYRDDLPASNRKEASEIQWARLLAPDYVQAGAKVAYCQQYGWAMRERMLLIAAE